MITTVHKDGRVVARMSDIERDEGGNMVALTPKASDADATVGGAATELFPQRVVH